MMRRATICLILAGSAGGAGEAIAQAPAQMNLVKGDFNRNGPGPVQRDLRQQDLRQQDLRQQDLRQQEPRQPDAGQPDLPQPGQPDSPQRPIATKAQAPQERQASGNPLWEIPLATLTATRERPIFSPSRRPAQSAPAPVAEPAPAPVVEAAAPESPPFTLLGTVVDTGESLAIFFSQASNSVVRRRIGEEEAGWVLQSVDARTMTLEKNARQATLTLPPRDSQQFAQGEANNVLTPTPGRPFPPPGAAKPPAPFPIAAAPRGRRRLPQ